MTARTRIMRFRSCTYQRIIMTVSTAGRTYRDARMARIGRMGRLPGASMTGDTVDRAWVANGGANKSAGACIMTARTGIMRICCRADQGICVTVAGAAGGCGYCNARMARIICMQ